MYQVNEYDIVGKTMNKLHKENYIVDMLIHALYSNDVDNEECYHIVKSFKERVLGDIDI